MKEDIGRMLKGSSRGLTQKRMIEKLPGRGEKKIKSALSNMRSSGDVVMIKVNGKNAKLTRQIEGAEVYFSAR